MKGKKVLVTKPLRFSEHPPELHRLNRVTSWIFLLGYLLTLADPAVSIIAWFAVALLSSTSLAFGTLGFAWVQQRGFWAGVAYLSAQTTLSTFLMILTGPGIGNTIMVLLVLAQASRILPLWLVLTFCLHLLVAHLGMDHWQDVVREGVGLFVAGVGIVLITRVAVNEWRLRVEKEVLADKLSEANRQLRSYALQVEELTAVRERHRIAREIHDSLGHHLTAAHIQLHAAEAVLPHRPEQVRQALEKARQLTQEALADVRRSVHALRLSSPPLPERLDVLAKEASVATVLSVVGGIRPLPKELEDNLYRIVQESLTNVGKHARATRASVTLHYDEQSVDLTVQDDGQGSSDLSGGFGLLGVRERAEAVGGIVDVKSSPGQGLTLSVQVPV